MFRSLIASLVAFGCATTASVERIPGAMDAREAWVAALSSGETDQVWDMLGPEARARFSRKSEFELWCRRYCPDLLVAAMADAAAPYQTVVVGEHTRLRRSEQRWLVVESDHLVMEDTALAALRRFERTTRSWALGAGLNDAQSDRVLGFLGRLAERLGEPLPRATGGRVVLALDGGGKVIVEKAARWEVREWSWQ